MGSIASIGLILAVLIGIGAILLERERRRTLALQAAAERLGWRFEPRPDPAGVIPAPERWELFSAGHSRQLRNLWQGERGGRRVAIFDYKYLTGAGKSQNVWEQTVLHVHSPALALPAFALRPEHIFHKIGGLFGYQDIDLPRDSEFSRRYLLRGQDEAAIRALFGSEVLDFYDRNPKCCTEGGGTDLFFWRTSRRVAPEDVEAFVDLGLALADRLERAAVAGGAGSD